MAKTIPADTTGLSLGYRILWRIQYTLLSFMGPADQGGMNDPRFRMRAERTGRVNAARAAKGLDPLDRGRAHHDERPRTSPEPCVVCLNSERARRDSNPKPSDP